jgi:hypothetical protein
MTKERSKPLGEMTLDELDEIVGQATTKAVSGSLAAGFPVIYWEDGHTIVLHPDRTKEIFPPGVRPSKPGKKKQ